jgi:hypothetical protein
MYPWPIGDFDYKMDAALDIAMDYLERTGHAVMFRRRRFSSDHTPPPGDGLACHDLWAAIRRGSSLPAHGGHDRRGVVPALRVRRIGRCAARFGYDGPGPLTIKQARAAKLVALHGDYDSLKVAG